MADDDPKPEAHEEEKQYEGEALERPINLRGCIKTNQTVGWAMPTTYYWTSAVARES